MEELLAVFNEWVNEDPLLRQNAFLRIFPDGSGGIVVEGKEGRYRSVGWRRASEAASAIRDDMGSARARTLLEEIRQKRRELEAMQAEAKHKRDSWLATLEIDEEITY